MHADQILVLHAGSIVENGTHEDLLAFGGRYRAMWEKQSKAEEAEKVAYAQGEKAKRLLWEAGIPAPGSASNQIQGGQSARQSETNRTSQP